MGARSLDTVLADMLGVIPESEGDLRARLNGVRTKARYRAPEVMPLLWADVQDLLWRAFGGAVNPSGWRGEVLRVWRGER